jgi:hypothetical protein
MAGRLAHLRVTDGHIAETLEHFPARGGDIVVADNGYGWRKSIAFLHTRGHRWQRTEPDLLVSLEPAPPSELTLELVD